MIRARVIGGGGGGGVRGWGLFLGGVRGDPGINGLQKRGPGGEGGRGSSDARPQCLSGDGLGGLAAKKKV